MGDKLFSRPPPSSPRRRRPELDTHRQVRGQPAANLDEKEWRSLSEFAMIVDKKLAEKEHASFGRKKVFLFN